MVSVMAQFVTLQHVLKHQHHGFSEGLNVRSKMKAQTCASRLFHKKEIGQEPCNKSLKPTPKMSLGRVALDPLKVFGLVQVGGAA